MLHDRYGNRASTVSAVALRHYDDARGSFEGSAASRRATAATEAGKPLGIRLANLAAE